MNMEQMLINYQEGIVTAKEPLWEGKLLTDFSSQQSGQIVFNMLAKECGLQLKPLPQAVENPTNIQNMALLAGYFEVLYKGPLKQNESQDKLIDVYHEILSLSLPKLARLQLVEVQEVLEKNQITNSDIANLVKDTLQNYSLLDDIGTKFYDPTKKAEYREILFQKFNDSRSDDSGKTKVLSLCSDLQTELLETVKNVPTETVQYITHLKKALKLTNSLSFHLELYHDALEKIIEIKPDNSYSMSLDVVSHTLSICKMLKTDVSKNLENILYEQKNQPSAAQKIFQSMLENENKPRKLKK